MMTNEELNQVVNNLVFLYLQKSDTLSAKSTPADYVNAYQQAVKLFTRLLGY